MSDVEISEFDEVIDEIFGTDKEQKIWYCCVCGRELNIRQVYVDGSLRKLCFNHSPDRAYLMKDGMSHGTPHKFLRRITTE